MISPRQQPAKTAFGQDSSHPRLDRGKTAARVLGIMFGMPLSTGSGPLSIIRHPSSMAGAQRPASKARDT
ncbi:hypothetical protein GGTG_10951 [Gaeumannomyces tritici R3-111a-1]|uniref:Uncharacterized protein n=1 Tax=Gaeumannomyces tritici (strain R3-111a-1) TaxID=644352 RepID=J3PBT0_GAET3|nr:hypothetical protein GGTG_10951 [Gaeumannomyces tritici R3-111a-1]EJT71697.1 hypothetical protein GGTG_10951 [Gaeumannomyces tritici R3-111a-1]